MSATAATATATADATTTTEATTATVEATTYVAPTASPAATVVTPALAIAISPPTMTVPGAGPEEDAAVEPLRAIVAIGCTGIGRISIVAVLTYGRPNVGVTPADVDSK
jgi:hypothetical protein